MNSVLSTIETVLSRAETVSLNYGKILGEQYAKSNYLYLLVEGTISFYYNMTSMEKEVEVGRASYKYAPIGLNVLSQRARNESTAKVLSDRATLLRWDKAQITEILKGNQREAADFLFFLNTKAHDLIREATELFASTPVVSKSFETFKSISDGYISTNQQDQIEMVIFLLQSHFMEVFDENELLELTKSIVRKQYKTDEVVSLQNHNVDGIFILESGEVQFSRINNEKQNCYNVMFRSISTPGYLLGSSGMVKQKSLVTVRTSKNSVILHIPSKAFEILEKAKPSFALKLQQRVLWLIRNQLRAVRARLIASHFDEEHMVVSGLIESNSTKVSIDSKLHKVPHLLLDKLTINEGLSTLHDVELNATIPEKNLASLCLDNLHQTQKEALFYDGLKSIYNSVADAPEHYEPSKIQFDCMINTRRAFMPASVIIKGFENLPEKPGHIFVYNHLLNDPYYTLPNHFQITLDSHFLSSLLFEKYNDVGQRIVRVGRNIEYGHQQYYERLNFIDVYTKDSEKLDESLEEKEKRRGQLFHQLESLLQQGKNIIVSPEGVSYPTEQSPGPFKSGMFRMALKMAEEPLIVPVVMVNFDKRIRNNKFACQIKQPFKLSKRMRQEGSTHLKTFLSKYQKEYKTYIKELAIHATQ